jgi:hypothetical protein
MNGTILATIIVQPTYTRSRSMPDRETSLHSVIASASRKRAIARADTAASVPPSLSGRINLIAAGLTSIR